MRKMARRKAGVKRKTPSKVNSDAEGEDSATIRDNEGVSQDEDRAGPEEESPNNCNEMNQMEEAEEEGKKEVNMKRKAESSAGTSPSKKTKLIKDGCCIVVGNLNNSKTFDEVKDSLANYLMTQSLLVQDIRLVRSKTHAYVDLASEMDLTKALTLNGEMILDKPVRISIAKVKQKKKVKAAPLDEKDKDARCLCVKNIPYNTTKADILKIFGEVINVWFPDGAESPKKGIAFLEFKNEAIATDVRERTQGVQLQGRVLFVDSVGKKASVPKVSKTNNDNNNAKAAVPPAKTLFVSNLPFSVKEHNLQKLFPKAAITFPLNKGKSKGYAFVEFASVAEAEKALQSSQNATISKRQIRVQFSETKPVSEKPKVLSKTLIVLGLSPTTTAETLKRAFEGCQSARVPGGRQTGGCKRFGFVEYKSEETCKAVKDAMEDSEIDGSKVTIAYAQVRVRRSSPGMQPAQPAGGDAS